MREAVEMQSGFRANLRQHSLEPLRHWQEIARFFINQDVDAHYLLVHAARICFGEIYEELRDCIRHRGEMLNSLLMSCMRRIT